LPTVREQCLAELRALRIFFDIAASQGIRLPEDSQLLRRSLDTSLQILLRLTSHASWRWPPPEFWSLIALAQHHGVPTRALDWTWNPLTAAYFAARDLPQSQHDSIVVWIFEYYSKHLDQLFEPQLPEERPLVFFTAPGADNQNLRAQRGMFMSQSHRLEDLDAAFAPAGYDVLAPHTLAVKNLPLLKRVIVKASEAIQILAHLAPAGVTAAALFPGLWGVARELEERRVLSQSTLPISQTNLTADLRARIKYAEKLGA